MKITVDRPLEESDQLTFIISVDDPHQVPLHEEEFLLLKELDQCKEVAGKLSSTNKFKNEIETALHGLKELLFNRVMASLRFSIENELRVKIDPMCQEIYNWLYDKQNGEVKNWLQEFDPQRVKYYFDNDKTSESDFGDDDGEQMDMSQSDLDTGEEED
jgi:hypothetical protein